MIKPVLRRSHTLFLAVQVALTGAVFSFTPLAVNAAEESKLQTQPQGPDELFGPLFVDVQTAKLFPDQKTFADAVPKGDPLMILADYRMQRRLSGFDLRHFVEVNFILPQEPEKYVPPAGQSLREHIDGLWPLLTHPADNVTKWDSLQPLPKQYVVPGGRFREVYYWDSYFTLLGLAESGQWDKVQDMVDNFAHEIDSWGHIPNGNRSYYLSRSQPPFFAMMVELLAQKKGDEVYSTYLPQLKQEYAYWMEGADALKPGEAHERVVKLKDGSLLNRYWDDKDTPRPEAYLDDVATAKNTPARPATEIYRDLRAAAASGWDFSSRWMDNPAQLGTIRTTSIVPVDLNALLYQLEQTLAHASLIAKDDAAANTYKQAAAARQKAIEANLWNAKEGWYADYDLKSQSVRNQLTAAALFPLYVHAASQERADKVAKATRHSLLKAGGLATTSVKTGQQWDAPNGWAPLQWVATEGLQNYGHKDLALEVSFRFLNNVQQVYNSEQKLVEKYDVSTAGTGGGGGEYPLQDGFGWTNGVTLKMLDLLCGTQKPCDNAPDKLPSATPGPVTDAAAGKPAATTEAAPTR
ncbi:alpha,alpha-trehalase TreA [Cedecea davisae]|uniref:Periplasmic trehalase n=1 Tax=Cedecea davisae TaxID=158484 RepID=A0ABS6DD43_9ENTR|nr:alpha,alpha-trehalase TreA [Cedecea davisae]MBU4680774.1 alpha,alpha-trehalase TreA [Cedecea davisae]MBU4687503.1 alpha,alpha-trehalase TreA [Cedecea davisae]